MSNVIVKRFVRSIDGGLSNYSIRRRSDGRYQLYQDEPYLGTNPPYESEDEPIPGIYAEIASAEAELLRMRPDLEPKGLKRSLSHMTTDKRLVVYIDVDDTLVRSAGTKIVPIPSVVEHVKELADSGAEIYCWSSVGAEYARSTARNVGIERCFAAFLPKPNVVIDDQAIPDWRRFATVHPLNVAKSVDEYRAMLDDIPSRSR